MGDNIYFRPKMGIEGTLEIWYVPQLVKLVNNSDVISWNPPISWEEYAVLAAAIRCMIKEESDIGPLMALLQTCRQRIIENASPRDAGEPDYIKDIYDRNNLYEDRLYIDRLGW
jgi:hypothetical protein